MGARPLPFYSRLQYAPVLGQLLIADNANMLEVQLSCLLQVLLVEGEENSL